MANPADKARQQYRQLVAKVEAFWARVAARYGDQIDCHRGCDECCHDHLSVTLVEAVDIVEALARLDAQTRSRLAARAAAGSPGACPALEDDGACAIYAARPLVCRSHGLPVRLDPEIPVVSCHLNYAVAGPGSVDDDCVLDQTTLSTMLGAVNAAYTAAVGEDGVPGVTTRCRRGDEEAAEAARVALLTLLRS